jgi:AcrR family transcriptional regulator
LSGRRAEAARNDGHILDAARSVFLKDPSAPIAAVAKHAGVGIGALYRRYRSKDELLQRLAQEGLQRYIATVEAALAQKGNAWEAFTGFMRGALDAGTGAITARYDAGFTATAEMHRLGQQAAVLTQRLLGRAKRAGVLRRDIEVGDISLLFEQLQSLELATPERTHQLRHRFLVLALEAFHKPGSAPLPGPAPRWEEISGRYRSPQARQMNRVRNRRHD